MSLDYINWKLKLREEMQEVVNSHRATKKEMIEAINSGIDFEEDKEEK